ncbi:DUF1064 domain-containing protein [Longibaculum muris]|uniref:DUF1064 domain-containing protein n=1 Tax=Longibaculum muris TaxID=1796628 RepID=UPI0022E73E00|nr:DUF1064 domain-containing protein [Longibaculum muris]
MTYYRKPSYSKYKNEKIVIDGHKFDSNAEGQRYLDLKLLERAGEIKDLRLQYKFVLQEGYVNHKGKKICPITYVADFVYYDVKKECTVVEDVKGMLTDVYKLKKKMFEFRYGIPITEIKH